MPFHPNPGEETAYDVSPYVLQALGEAPFPAYWAMDLIIPGTRKSKLRVEDSNEHVKTVYYISSAPGRPSSSLGLPGLISKLFCRRLGTRDQALASQSGGCWVCMLVNLVKVWTPE
ncbi:hypothetical protein VTO73DRAFT_7848 [Trametes versicolor]